MARAASVPGLNLSQCLAREANQESRGSMEMILVEAGIVVAIRKPLARIEHAVVALHSIQGSKARGVAGIAAQREHHVRAAEGVSQHAYPGTDVPPRAHGEDHAFRTIVLADSFHLFLDEVKGLVPGDLLPVALAALPHPLERSPQALWVLHVLGHG
jgi:hypothetical protein